MSRSALFFPAKASNLQTRIHDFMEEELKRLDKDKSGQLDAEELTQSRLRQVACEPLCKWSHGHPR
jgi:hypothetical protein